MEDMKIEANQTGAYYLDLLARIVDIETVRSFIRQATIQGVRFDYSNSKRYSSFNDYMHTCLFWYETKEGDIFWKNIADYKFDNELINEDGPYLD